MKYKKIENSNYNLHLIKTNKYKQTVVRVSFRNELTFKSLLHQKLISEILLESNSIYSTKRLLSIKTESLYNLSAYTNESQSGDVLVTSYNMSFLNDKYSEEGLFRDCIKFMSDVIFKPKVSDEKFDDKALELAKKRMKEDLKSIKESPMSYTMEKVYSYMGKGTPLAISLYGKENKIEEVNSHELYLSYLKSLETSIVDIFVVGDIDFNDAEKVIADNFGLSDRKNLKLNHFIEYNNFKNNFTTRKEKLENNQSILLLGFKLKDLTSFEKQYVLPVYSYILGGGPDSKLFKNVREKHSLCYSISCSVKSVSNLMFITAGINSKDYKKALKLTLKEVDNMRNGEFDDTDINKAILTYLSVYKELSDSVHSVTNVYVNHEFIDSDLLEDKEKMIKKVTKEDIMKVIDKIYPDLIFFLEGTKENEEESI